MDVDYERTILLGIKPQFAEDILDGRKKWEYKRVPPKIIAKTKMVLYASGNMQSIIGDCTVTEILRKPVNELIDKTINESTSTREGLQEYFSGLEIGSALRVEKPKRYANFISLTDIKEKAHNFVPPQNFYYLRRGDQRFAFIFAILDSSGSSERSTQKRITSF